ncbi:MAG: TolC family protein [Halanaerobiales bacterium]
MNKKIFGFVLLILFSLVTKADELNFDQLVEIGLENNLEVVEKRDAIRDIERERELLKSSLDWHFGFDGDISFSDGPAFTSPVLDESEKNMNLSLSTTKTTKSGLSISSGLFLNDSKPLEFVDLDEKYSFRLNISKRLYPYLPTDIEKGFIQVDNQYLVAKVELERLKKEKEINWLEQYINLIRIEDKMVNLALQYELAEEDLANVQAQKEIAEAGEEQILMAEINLKEIEIQLEQLKVSYAQVLNSFANELAINNEELSFSQGDSSVDKLIRKAEAIDINFRDKEVEKMLINNNIQLKNLNINIEYALKELEWKKKEDGLKVDGSAGYNYDSSLDDDKDSVNLTLGFSYDFYDGGSSKLNLKGMEDRIESLEIQYNNTLKELKLQYDSLLEQYRINNMRLQTNELSLQKAELELLLYQKQLEQGAITDSQYQELSLQTEQAEIELREIKDKLILDKLRIALFLGVL